VIDQQSVERAAERFSAPEGSFERLALRRDRKRRNQRIGAGVLGIAVAIAVGWLGINAIRSTPPVPADPTPTEELGIFAPVAGHVVYGTRAGIYAVDPMVTGDGSTPVQLTSEDSIPLGWSSDGTELLFMRSERSGPGGSPVWDLVILHADGSETQVAPDLANFPDATISPDGSRVVFAAGEGLYVVDADGGPAEVLVEAPGDSVYDPTFSPDGTQVAYAAGWGDHSHHIWVTNADGTDAHEIVFNERTAAAGHVNGLAWSPAGDRIALGLDSWGIFTFAPDGSGFTRVINSGDHPYWSPDGSQIAFSLRWPFTDRVFERGLAIADADGSNVREFGFAESGPWHPGPIASTDPPPVPIDDPTPTPALSEFRRGAEFIVFEPLGTGLGWDLAAQDPETGEVRKLVETDGIVDCSDTEGCSSFVESAEWSSDGRWLAFEVSNTSLDGPPLGPCAPTVGVWVTNALGELRQLTTPCDTMPPGSEVAVEEMWEWSPDGTRIAYAQIDGETDELFVIDPSDGGRTSLGTAGIPRDGAAPPAMPGWALEWSPDGTRIAYVEGGSVSVVDVDGGERSLLADSFVDIVEIAWSPDGTHILVHDQGRYRIQVMNADGSDLHVVLEGEDACCETDWSPDGDRILYMLSVAGPGEGLYGLFDTEVWTVSPDGSNPIKVFDSNGCDSGSTPDGLPVWAPDGTQVAYIACRVWVVANADGTGDAQPIDKLVWRSWKSGGLTEADLAQIGQIDH
jgi:Tol biopolymer transport system component